MHLTETAFLVHGVVDFLGVATNGQRPIELAIPLHREGPRS